MQEKSVWSRSFGVIWVRWGFQSEGEGGGIRDRKKDQSISPLVVSLRVSL